MRPGGRIADPPAGQAGRSAIAVAALAAALGGCTNDAATIKSLRAANDRLSASNARLVTRLDDANSQLAALRKQNAALLDLGDKRLKLIPHVTGIQFGSATGGYPVGKPAEGVKVFLQPLDQDGSVLKAGGAVTIQLYDLAAPPEANLVGQCHYTVEQVARHWYSGFLTYHFSFECPWKSAPPKHDGITVRATWLDYLTGKAFTTQGVFRVSLAGQ